MQSSLSLPTLVPLGLGATILPCKCWSNSLLPELHNRRRLPLLRTTVANNDPTTVDYSSMASSVFPAEACETIGGEACDVDMYPEAKLTPQPQNSTAASEAVEREYLQYDGPKTVFPGEACDDLGGEFCEPDYQTGVY